MTDQREFDSARWTGRAGAPEIVDLPGWKPAHVRALQAKIEQLADMLDRRAVHILSGKPLEIDHGSSLDTDWSGSLDWQTVVRAGIRAGMKTRRPRVQVISAKQIYLGPRLIRDDVYFRMIPDA